MLERVLASVAAVGMVVLLSSIFSSGEEAPPDDLAAGLCEGPLEGSYLEFHWDDVRTGDRETFEEALAICLETCPEAPKCAPVVSVAQWYEAPEAARWYEAPAGATETRSEEGTTR